MENNNPLMAEQPIARRNMTVFFVVDSSGSMKGTKMDAVNSAIRSLIPDLSHIAETNVDSRISIACMEFNENVQWICEPTDVKDVHWVDLTADGRTYMDMALDSLRLKMNSHAFLPAPQYAPVVILLSDGVPSRAYKDKLALLQQNKWWTASIRIAISIGDDANREVLSDIVGNPEMVLTAYTPELLRDMLRFVTISSSTIASRSCAVGVGDGMDSKQSTALQQIREYKEDLQDELKDLSHGF